MVFPSLYVPNPRGEIHWVTSGTISIMTYVGVIRFICMFSNSFYQFDSHGEICVALANL